MRNLVRTGDMVRGMSGERQSRQFLHYALIVLGSACAGLEPESNGEDTDTVEAADSQLLALDSTEPPVDTYALNDTTDALIDSDSVTSPKDVSDAQRATSDAQRVTNDSSSAVNDVTTDVELLPNRDVTLEDAQASPMSPCPDITTGNDFPVTLHRLSANGQLGDPLEPLSNIEIVQGPQGGVHIEFGYRVIFGSGESSKLFASFSGANYQNASGPPVGIGGTELTVLFSSPNGIGYDSQENLVIFEQNEAYHYQDQPCCAVAEVAILDPVTKEAMGTAGVMIELFCVDVF